MFQKVRLDIKLPMSDGKEFTWSVCNVPRLVEYFAAEASTFRVLMERGIAASHGEPLRGILYLDEVTPGNVLRPDNKRKFWAI